MFEDFYEFVQYIEMTLDRSLGGVDENDHLSSVLSFDEETEAFESVESVTFRQFSATEIDRIDTFGELYQAAQE